MIYKIALTRTYVVTIEAENEDDARTLSEFYLGDCPDLSSEEHQNERKFSIKSIEMVYNNADEVLEVIEEDEI